MVNTEIPKNYTASPSSFTGTPQLTINHEVTLELESSHAFEGPEKLLEVWFAPSASTLPPSVSPLGLKAVTAAKWTEMLDLVHCKVLSIVESDQVDAYLLSESSMFVFPHKLVLKTCGTTTLLCGLPRILEIAALSVGFPHVSADLNNGTPAAAPPYRVFYSRKNFLYPDQQRGPHRSWRDEVRALDRLFRGGSAYMIGKMNGEHWYLYLTEPDTRLTPPATPENERFSSKETSTRFLDLPRNDPDIARTTVKSDGGKDETLEILMTDLDEKNSRQFYLDNASAVAEGQFYNDFHKARREMNQALGAVKEEEEHKNVSIRSGASYNGGADAFDVFEQTSSDHSDMHSDDGNMIFPEELTTEGHALGTVVSDTCGLSEIYPRSKYPDARIDAYLFTPCGFSANGVIPALSNSTSTSSTHYFTVHVTPEPQCSYASFETNVPANQTGRETSELVEQVVNIFQPSRFTVTLFEARLAEGSQSSNMEYGSSKLDAIKGYRRVDRIKHDLDGYDLVFRYYERHDWKGGAPRLGELS